MSTGEFVFRRQEAEVGHGHLLRVTAVEQPRNGRTIVLRKIMKSERGRTLLEPGLGEQLTVSEQDVPELIQMLERIEDGEV